MLERGQTCPNLIRAFMDPLGLGSSGTISSSVVRTNVQIYIHDIDKKRKLFTSCSQSSIIRSEVYSTHDHIYNRRSFLAIHLGRNLNVDLCWYRLWNLQVEHVSEMFIEKNC